MKYTVILAAIALAVIGCDKPSSDGTVERARAEAEAGKDVTNENLAQRAEQAEAQLRRRYRFYDAIAHEFRGSFQLNGNTYSARLDFSSTLPFVDDERVRTLEEIQYDLNNLLLNLQINMVKPSNGTPLLSCSFAGIRPDIENGEINFLSPQCNIAFTVSLGSPSSARGIAQNLLAGRRRSVNQITVQVASRLSAVAYTFVARKR